jgi:opacity protein-like surface antigen
MRNITTIVLTLALIGSATAADLTLALIGSATAADLKGNSYAGSMDPLTATPAGAYLSAGLGAVAVDSEIAGMSLASKGAALDARAGYDFRLSYPGYILGGFGSITIQNTDGHGLSGAQDWGWEVGIRAGRYFDNALLYGVLGYRGQQYALNGTGRDTALSGLEYGAGVEVALKSGVIFGVEATRVDYGSWSPVAGLTLANSEFDGKVRVGRRF